MTKKSLLDIKEIGFRNCLVQMKGQRKVTVSGDFSQCRCPGPPVEAWTSQPWRDVEVGMLCDMSRDHPIAYSLGSSDTIRMLCFVVSYSFHTTELLQRYLRVQLEKET